MEQVRTRNSWGVKHGVRCSDAIGYGCSFLTSIEARPSIKQREVLAQMARSQEDMQALLRQSPRLRAAAESNPKVRKWGLRRRFPRSILSTTGRRSGVFGSALRGLDDLRFQSRTDSVSAYFLVAGAGSFAAPHEVWTCSFELAHCSQVAALLDPNPSGEASTLLQYGLLSQGMRHRRRRQKRTNSLYSRTSVSWEEIWADANVFVPPRMAAPPFVVAWLELFRTPERHRGCVCV